MVIKASSAGEIRSLVDALSSADAVRREAAIARLTVIGTRATERLVTAYPLAKESAAKVAILRTLEGLEDARALTLACDALQEGGDVAVAAAALLKPLLDAGDRSAASAALDALVEAALAPSMDRRVRLAAYEALRDIPAEMLERIADASQIDLEGVTREDAAHAALFADGADGRLPDDPTALHEAVIATGPAAPLVSLQKLIEAVRTRERTAKDGPARASWLLVRGAAHQALALRGSRIAVYDLRETIESAEGPLPPAFLSAMRCVGDARCVESIAAALARAPANDLWWRHQLASALRGIAKRERMTKRHASIRRALARWPQAAEAFN